MAGVTSTGFVTETFSTIRNRILEAARSPEYFGTEFPTSPDSVFGQLAAIMSAALKESGWDLAQGVYDQFILRSASGKNLDDIASYTGSERLLESGSSGDLLFKGFNGSVVPQNTAVKDVENRVVTTDNLLNYDRTSCYDVVVEVLTLEDNTSYTIAIDGSNYSITSDTDATNEEILIALNNAIGVQVNYSSEITTDGYLRIFYNSRNNSLNVTVGANLQILEVGALVNATSIETGDLSYLANTLTIFESIPSGTNSVTNPVDFQQGRDDETDEEFRLRIAEQKSSVGTATKPAIESSLTNIEGVTSAFVLENITMSEVNGQPPKSIQIYISGGDDDEIAEVIWNTKPAAIPTYGTTQKNIIDQNGDTQAVFFSRPEVKYAWVNVTYTIYSEEDFPSDGEVEIASTVVEYGDSLGVGVDIIPKRFSGKIYDSVTGLDDVTVEIAITEALLPAPDPLDYVTTRIPVEDNVGIDFDVSRVSVSL